MRCVGTPLTRARDPADIPGAAGFCFSRVLELAGLLSPAQVKLLAGWTPFDRPDEEVVHRVESSASRVLLPAGALVVHSSLARELRPLLHGELRPVQCVTCRLDVARIRHDPDRSDEEDARRAVESSERREEPPGEWLRFHPATPGVEIEGLADSLPLAAHLDRLDDFMVPETGWFNPRRLAQLGLYFCGMWFCSVLCYRVLRDHLPWAVIACDAVELFPDP